MQPPSRAKKEQKVKRKLFHVTLGADSPMCLLEAWIGAAVLYLFTLASSSSFITFTTPTTVSLPVAIHSFLLLFFLPFFYLTSLFSHSIKAFVLILLFVTMGKRTGGKE